MSTPMEEATAGLREARESLRRAEEDFRSWRAANPTDFSSTGFLALSAEVTRCTVVLAGAQRNYDSAADLSKQRVLKERDLLLSRSPTLVTRFPLSPPSTHPSEHTLTPAEKVIRKQTRNTEKCRKKEENAQLKSQTISFYYGESQPSTIKDMLTNYDFPIHDVHRSHIFQASWEEGKLTELILAGGLEFRDITKDSPENMLLLHGNVETKYDCGQLLIEYDESSEKFKCRILDQRIANEMIFLDPQTVTFGQYDGQALHFPTSSRPLRRLIHFRAIVNRLVAIDRGYIQAEEYMHLMNCDQWSPGTNAFFESIIDWKSNIPLDSHLYVNTAFSPEPE